MKKAIARLILLLPLLLAINLFTPKIANAQVSCPSAEMQCGELDAQGGCENPCLRVPTEARGGGRSGPAWCQCQLPLNPPGTVPEGGECQIRADCVSSASYCWAEPGQSATCHSTSPGVYPTPADQSDPTCDPPGGGLGTGINTAIGCIPVASSEDFIGFILRWAIGIGGGIAFLLILIAGFQIMTSQGSPDKLQAGKELLTSAIVGIILIIFSIFILELIGVDILGIPGFGN